MKLYFSPGACALASQIALREAEAKFELVRVDLKTKQCNEGDYTKINLKGYIPALRLDDGTVLTEGAMILQWVADHYPMAKLLPKTGTLERYRAIEWLNYVATELHKGIGALFSPIFDDQTKEQIKNDLRAKYAFVDEHLAKNRYLLGDTFSVADAYLYNVLRWPNYVKQDISSYKNIMTFMRRLEERPTVLAAVEAEGIKL